MCHLIFVHPQGPVVRQLHMWQVIGEDRVMQMEAVIA